MRVLIQNNYTFLKNIRNTQLQKEMEEEEPKVLNIH